MLKRNLLPICIGLWLATFVASTALTYQKVYPDEGITCTTDPLNDAEKMRILEEKRSKEREGKSGISVGFPRWVYFKKLTYPNLWQAVLVASLPAVLLFMVLSRKPRFHLQTLLLVCVLLSLLLGLNLKFSGWPYSPEKSDHHLAAVLADVGAGLLLLITIFWVAEKRAE